MRKPIPSDKTRDVLEFATKRPRDRLESITNGLQVTNPLCLCHARVSEPDIAGFAVRPIRICPPVRNVCKYEWTIEGGSQSIETTDASLWAWQQAAYYRELFSSYA